MGAREVKKQDSPYMATVVFQDGSWNRRLDRVGVNAGCGHVVERGLSIYHKYCSSRVCTV